MALSTHRDLQSTSANLSHSIPSLTNESGCQLPWVDFAEERETSVDLVILICLLLTLIFDIALIGIIIAHDDLRKKARIMHNFNDVLLPQRVNLFMISICISDIASALFLIVLIQPGSI